MNKDIKIKNLALWVNHDLANSFYFFELNDERTEAKLLKTDEVYTVKNFKDLQTVKPFDKFDLVVVVGCHEVEDSSGVIKGKIFPLVLTENEKKTNPHFDYVGSPCEVSNISNIAEYFGFANKTEKTLCKLIGHSNKKEWINDNREKTIPLDSILKLEKKLNEIETKTFIKSVDKLKKNHDETEDLY